MKRLYNVTRISTNDKMCEVPLPYGNCITCPWSCDTEVSVILSIISIKNKKLSNPNNDRRKPKVFIWVNVLIYCVLIVLI